MALAKEPKRTPIFHVLYADDERLDSLYAQLNEGLAVKETTRTHSSNTAGVEGEIDLAIVKGMGKAGDEYGNEHMVEYSLADARYFSVLQSLCIDVTQPEDSAGVTADGVLHVIKGKLCLSGSEGYAQLIPMAKKICEMMKPDRPKSEDFPNKKEFSAALSQHKSSDKEYKDIEKGFEFIQTVQMPLAGKIDLDHNSSVYIPLKKECMRMQLSQIAEIFGGTLPFEWTLVGYVYPYETSSIEEEKQAEIGDFWGVMDSCTHAIRQMCAPKNVRMSMIPLLILQ